MKTKIVYALVSSPSDFYMEQAMISVHSLRMYNPNAVVELVVDAITDMNLVEKRAKIREYVDEVHVIETPEGYNPVQRSRYLKTNLRKFVKGDFLFIDCDTIICDTLAEIDEVDADIAMVADLNEALLLADSNTIEKYKRAGFGDATGLPYFNSGVIYAKDTLSVHQFYNQWYENWRKSDGRGVKYDQPALCATNVECGRVIKELDGIWNCQFKFGGYRTINKARILHYYSNNGRKNDFFTLPMDMLYQQVKDDGINPLIEKLIGHAKTDFYAVMTVNKEQSMSFFNSHLLYLYTNRPALYEMLERLGKVMEKIMYK